jgi:23S rRNA (pseudouridine1915-N3)-methyltransferase
MKLRVIWTGRTRNPHLAALSEDYLGRIRRLLPLDLAQLREPRMSDDRRRASEEGKRIMGRIAPGDYVVALDEGGRARTSQEMAGILEVRMGSGRGDLVFVVGGPAGLSAELRERANLLLSLSKLTLSHDLARILLLEQIYRSLTIIRNLPYPR